MSVATVSSPSRAPLLLDRTEHAVRARRRELLRLDCVAGNPSLRAYYERFGCEHVRDVRFPAPWPCGLWSPAGTVLSLYEKSLERGG
ncbi:MAG: hypothetical protein M3143_12105 [Actinomycetota bacterium]|nr:hypothetical protein [Actinomycetota bacterium]